MTMVTTQSRIFQISLVCGLSVFENLRFRDGLVWTEGLALEIMLSFQNSGPESSHNIA